MSVEFTKSRSNTWTHKLESLLSVLSVFYTKPFTFALNMKICLLYRSDESNITPDDSHGGYIAPADLVYV